MLAATNQKKTTKSNTSRTKTNSTGNSTKKNTKTTAKQSAAKKSTSAKGKTGNHTGKKSSGKKDYRYEEERYDSAMIREAILLTVSAVAIVFLLSNFGLCGKLGEMLSSWMFGLFGITAYIFPVLFFLGVLFFVSNVGIGKAKIKLASAIVVYLAICAILQQIFLPYDKNTGLVACYSFAAMTHQGGGWFGALIGHMFVPVIGSVGMYVLMMALILAGFVLITEKSLVGGVKKHGSRMVHTAAEDAARLAEVNRIRYEEKKQRQQTRSDKKVKGVVSPVIVTLDESPLETKVAEEIPYGEQPEYVENAGMQYNDNYDNNYNANYNSDYDVNYDSNYNNNYNNNYDGNYDDSFNSNDDTGYDENYNVGYDRNYDNSYKNNYDNINRKMAADVSEEYQESRRKEQHKTDEIAMPYEEVNIFNYEDDGVLLNPLETSPKISEEKPPQDVTVYQRMTVNAQAEIDIPPEMVPFPIDSIRYDYPVEEVQKEEGWLEESQSLQFLHDEQESVEPDSFSDLQDIQPEDSFVPMEFKSDIPPVVKEFKSDTSPVIKEFKSDTPPVVKESKSDTQPAMKEFKSDTQPVVKEFKSDTPPVSSDFKPEPPPVPEYRFPDLSLLTKGSNHISDKQQAEENKMVAKKLETTLRNFGVGVKVTEVTSGPTVTRYELLPDQGVKVSRIVGLADDIKLSLAAADIRIEAPIPGKSAVGIEVPNKENATVMLRDLLESENFQNHKSPIAFAVGKDIGGQTIVTDIAKMPHALIAGATGSGKSVCINTLIMSILYKAHPDDVKLIMVDPKVVELSIYNGIPHLLIPVVTDPKKAAGALNWAVAEMTDRYNKFSEWNVRNIQGYNEKVDMLEDVETGGKAQKMPQIVIIIDELADLMMVASSEVEEAICRLAQLARAAGIHLIIATQRPSVNVITGLIKANIPSRIAFAVSSGVDSRTILDTVGAEKLLGKGDMLFAPYGSSSPMRIQGAFVSDQEVNDVVEFLKSQESIMAKSAEATKKMMTVISSEGGGGSSGNSRKDDYFVEAGRLILQSGKASIGMLQRKFKVGFNRAARIMDQLADAGVVGPEEGTKPRKILMSMEEFEQYIEEYV